jgi:hypothetical protein
LQAYFRFAKVVANVHAKNVLTAKIWSVNSDDGEKGLLSLELEYFIDVLDYEDRFTVFTQTDSRDNLVTRQIFAFKFNVCKMRNGSQPKDNILMRTIHKEPQTLSVKCPFVKGTTLNTYNQSYDDALFPPIPSEVRMRCHLESFGKLQGTKKWKKLISFDYFFRVKK